VQIGEVPGSAVIGRDAAIGQAPNPSFKPGYEAPTPPGAHLADELMRVVHEASATSTPRDHARDHQMKVVAVEDVCSLPRDPEAGSSKENESPQRPRDLVGPALGEGEDSVVNAVCAPQIRVAGLALVWAE
jgi:hypothetical protein